MAQELLDSVARAVRHIRSSSGYGTITITLRLDRDIEVSTSVTERVRE